MLDSCQITDSIEAMQKLKERAEQFLEEKVLNAVEDIHYVATILYPPFKDLAVLRED